MLAGERSAVRANLPSRSKPQPSSELSCRTRNSQHCRDFCPRTRAASSRTDVSRTILALPCPSGGINLVLLPRSRSLKCGREDGHRTQKWRSLRFGSAISIGWTMPTWASFPSWRLASARPSCCLRLVLGGDSLSSTTMAICTWYLPA